MKPKSAGNDAHKLFRLAVKSGRGCLAEALCGGTPRFKLKDEPGEASPIMAFNDIFPFEVEEVYALLRLGANVNARNATARLCPKLLIKVMRVWCDSCWNMGLRSILRLLARTPLQVAMSKENEAIISLLRANDARFGNATSSILTLRSVWLS